jgi:hypothetical protein
MAASLSSFETELNHDDWVDVSEYFPHTAGRPSKEAVQAKSPQLATAVYTAGADMPTRTGQNYGKVHTDDCWGGGDPCGVTTNLQEVVNQIVTSTPTASAQFSVIPPAYKINLGNG